MRAAGGGNRHSACEMARAAAAHRRQGPRQRDRARRTAAVPWDQAGQMVDARRDRVCRCAADWRDREGAQARAATEIRGLQVDSGTVTSARSAPESARTLVLRAALRRTAIRSEAAARI